MLDSSLLDFTEKLTKSYGDKPVTMLNLLRFNEGKDKQYAQYGHELQPIIHKRGGDAKLVGKVVHDETSGFRDPGDDPKGSKAGEWWDEVSLVHYPSIRAFSDMLASEEYQDVNKRLREGVSRGLLMSRLICADDRARHYVIRY